MAIQSEAILLLLNWADVVVFAPSSGGGGIHDYKETYLENLKFVLTQIHKNEISLQKFILVGSTGVYPRKQEGVWFEGALIPIENPRQEILLETEKTLIESGLDYAILRCGGIYGEGRGNFSRIVEVGKMLSSELTDQFYPLINQDDICGVMRRVIEAGFSRTYNLVDDSGLTRRQLYSWIAEEAGIPVENDGEAPPLPGRQIPNTKLKNELGYVFRSPRVTDYLKNRLVRKK